MKIVITDVYDLKYNYGVQGLVLPLVERIRKYYGAEFIMPVQSVYYNKPNIDFAREKGITLISYWKYSFFIDLFHALLKFTGFFRSKSNANPLSQYQNLTSVIRGSFMVLDVAGIEFIGNAGIKKKWGELLFTGMFQKIAGRHSVPYFKYTKSYGPLEGFLFRRAAGKLLGKLPFLLIRGSNNLEEMKKTGLRVPMYLFPDVSLVLKPSPRITAVDHLKSLGLDTNRPIAGVSPSRVLSSISPENRGNILGENHLELIRRLIDKFRELGYQVLLIPHAIDRIDRNKCDRQLSIELMGTMDNTENVYLTGEDLSYSDVRAVIGQLSFYVTGRYHSVASALYMGIPVISLAWHIKYKDIMGEFLDEFLAVDCRSSDIGEAMTMIMKYHDNREWFDRDKIRQNRRRIERQVDRSIRMIVEYAQIDRLESSFR